MLSYFLSNIKVLLSFSQIKSTAVDGLLLLLT